MQKRKKWMSVMLLMMVSKVMMMMGGMRRERQRRGGVERRPFDGPLLPPSLSRASEAAGAGNPELLSPSLSKQPQKT